jgi:hypothetical protein
MDPVLIPPGRTQVWKCPAGTTPAVQKGQVLKFQDKAAMYVADVTPDSIVLGPLMAGDLEIANLCSGQGAVTFRIEAPDPSKVEKKVQVLSPVALSYPWWLWVVLALGVIGAGACAWFVRRLLLAKPEDSLKLSRARLRKTPTEKMEIFLSKVETQQLVDKNDVASSQMIYGEGLACLRLLLQAAYQFKAPGATTTEFIAELKAQAIRKPTVLAAPQLAQLESTFMQAKQVTYAREIPELALRKAYLKSLKDFAAHLGAKIAATEASLTTPKRKPLFKPKEKKPS